MIFAVQELRKLRDSDMNRAKEFTQTTSEDILDTNKRGEISNVAGNGCYYLLISYMLRNVIILLHNLSFMIFRITR